MSIKNYQMYLAQVFKYYTVCTLQVLCSLISKKWVYTFIHPSVHSAVHFFYSSKRFHSTKQFTQIASCCWVLDDTRYYNCHQFLTTIVSSHQHLAPAFQCFGSFVVHFGSTTQSLITIVRPLQLGLKIRSPGHDGPLIQFWV